MDSLSDLPSSINVITIDRPGGPDVLVPGTRPMPQHLDEHKILIKVDAAGVNRPDVLQRVGAYPPPKGASDIPGLEVAGTVVARARGRRPP
jgi:NADPH2:quinone reductase